MNFVLDGQNVKLPKQWADVSAGRQPRPATESISPLSVWMISWQHAAIAGCYRRLLSHSSLLAGNLRHNSLSFLLQILHNFRGGSGMQAFCSDIEQYAKTQVKVYNRSYTFISWGGVGTSRRGKQAEPGDLCISTTVVAECSGNNCGLRTKERKKSFKRKYFQFDSLRI